MDNSIRRQFPLFEKRDVIYLDSAASAQTPHVVLAAMQHYYDSCRSNVHRGVYSLSVEATELYEGARTAVRDFIGAAALEEVIFTRGTTESINLVMQGWARPRLAKGDKIVTTIAEHHSNFVPWQQLALRNGCEFVCCGLTKDERIDEQAVCDAIDTNTKLVAVTLLANGLGVMPEIARIVKAARKVGAKVLVDAAQAAPHMPLNVAALDVDFLAFSGHKLYGPTGVGVLWGRRALLEEVEPIFYGGDMISSVSVAKTEFNSLPHRLEAGTPNVAGVIGLGAAIGFVKQLGWNDIQHRESELIAALEEGLYAIQDLRILGPRGAHHGLLAFSHPAIHPHDFSQYFDNAGIAVRAGHHCAQPLLRSLGINASTRASVGVYNTLEDVSRFVKVLRDGIKYFT